MKKEYITPILDTVKVESESPMMAGTENDNDWAQTKKGFFDEDDDMDENENKNLWDY